MKKPVGNADMTPMSICNVCCSWIAPDGARYHLGELGSSHGGVASRLGDTRFGRDLDEQSYVHISFGSPYMGKPGAKPTQAQLDSLFDIEQELTRRKSLRAGYIHTFLAKQLEEVTA